MYPYKYSFCFKWKKKIFSIISILKSKIKIVYLKSVAFPVNGPKRISPNGGLNPRIVKASSCVIGFRLILKNKDRYLGI